MLYVVRLTIVQSVRFASGHLEAKMPYWRVGVWGSQAGLTRKSAKRRSIFAMRRMASASRGVMPFQMPQMFSHDSYPTPLKKANCKLLVLSLFQRSQTLTIWRGSSHLPRLMDGMKGY